jgi:hypothetical protein
VGAGSPGVRTRVGGVLAQRAASVSLRLVFVAEPVSCQSLRYQDADTVGDAFGMMSIRMSELSSAEFGRRYAEDTASQAVAIDAWHKDDAYGIDVASRHHARMLDGQPEPVGHALTSFA